MAEKLLINDTGHPLTVQLIVRKGTDPMMDAGTVDVDLGSGKGNAEHGGSDHVRLVTYGDEVNIYLNGIVVGFEGGGENSQQRFQVLQRGVPLDNDLNMYNTVQFVYAQTIQLRFSNTFDVTKLVAGTVSG